MVGINEEPEIEIEEYEEIVGNWDQSSVQEGATDNRAVSIHCSHQTNNLILILRHTSPSDRPWDQLKGALPDKKTSRIRWS